ncbi:MAG TPA: ATP-binding protein, partial [Actinomycetes bacterium]|nr:ATP-binding protein [Actinomycetes bacterium]
GPDGLAGMAVRSGRLLRPLLGARRADTRACCAAIGLEWREDPTNAGDGPLRNRVRQRLLPQLEELRPGATRALARTATLAADERDWLDPLVADALAAALTGGVAEDVAEGVDSQPPSNPPSVTLPDGAPTTRGAGAARLDDGTPTTGGASSAEFDDGVPATGGAGTAGLDPEALAGLPVALARRVVRAAARQAGRPVPDAATTDRILGLPAD